MPLRSTVPPQPLVGHRDWYLFEAVRALPRILLLADRNPISPTYGCFDREYWHYRTADFPCGMSQEFVLAVAMAVDSASADNPYAGCERLRDLAVAGMRFAARSAHKDGSCDDYFPWEKALGAAVFSLYAMTEAYQVLGLRDDALLAFFSRRARWLLGFQETGKLANHQALAALALWNTHVLTGEEAFRHGSEQRLATVLSWRRAEGWFQEYAGCDPGYHSVTIDFLAKLRQKTGDARLTPVLREACAFAAHFMHPDGSYAGEYGSRNTHHCMPHGFELMAGESREALQVAELYLRRALPRRTRHTSEDNRMVGHLLPNWFQAWRDYAGVPARNRVPCLVEPRTAYFPEAGLLVRQEARSSVVAAAHKGGVLRVTHESGPVYADTGPMVRLADGRALVAHLHATENRVSWDAATGTLVVEGHLCRRRAPLMTPWRQMALRLASMAAGRIDPNWLRRLVQRFFIEGRARAASSFRRTIRLLPDAVEVTDEVRLQRPSAPPVEVLACTDATSIYVAASNAYQEASLLPIRRLDALLAGLKREGAGRETFRVELPP